jgi:predicted alpha-1,2-mannosidase
MYIFDKIPQMNIYRHLIFCILILLKYAHCSNLEKVNPLMGTNNSFLLSHGNTLPLVGQPFGFTYWTPQTVADGMFKYNYSDSLFYGFRATHIPSPWMGDFASFLIYPSTETLEVNKNKRFTTFYHRNEKSKPSEYAIQLHKNKIEAKITATERCGYHRYTFPRSKQSTIYVDLLNQNAEYEYNSNKNQLYGRVKNNSGGVPQGFTGYFIIQFSKKPKEFGAIKNDSNVFKKEQKAGAETLCTYFIFETQSNESIDLQIATSFISIDQALLNFSNEIGTLTYQKTVEKNEKNWEKSLSKIEVKGGTDEQQKVFYSCLYRSLLFPTKFYEINSHNEKVYYSPYDGKIHKGVMYTNNGIWDTFRAALPLLTIIEPEIHQEFCQSLVNAYKEGGWLPRWLSPGYREIMIGVHSVSVFADAYSKGLMKFDLKTAFEGVLKDAYKVNPTTIRNKEGLEHYNEKGYVLSTVREGVAKNLEYAYDDYCGYLMAKALGNEKEANAFLKRAFNYKNTFDGSTGLMRGKDKKGRWRTPFNPFAWGGDFTEGNSWHYTWSVFHDPKGLISLMGGDAKMIAKMDSVFTLPPIYNYDYYGWKIHEITELELTNMGQYSHGNQPIQHFIYLYNYAGVPWKAQYWNRHILNKLYNSSENGYCGDEDNGQTSAWYVMSAMGFYSVCPGNTQYVISSPLFDEIVIHFPREKDFVISSKNNSEQNIYLESVELNGKPHLYSYFTHNELLNGGSLNIVMGNKPNKLWANAVENRPFSLSKSNACSAPYLIGNSGVFEVNIPVSLASLTDSVKIYYTLDGSAPTENSIPYIEPLTITSSLTLKAKAFKKGYFPSEIFETSFSNTYLTPSNLTETNKGLTYKYFEGTWENLPDFSSLIPKKSGISNSLNIEAKERKDMFAFLFEGYINIPNDGMYTFYYKSDDGCRFYLGDILIHEALGRHGMEEYNEKVLLKKGKHKIKLEYNEIDGGEGLKVSIESQKIPKVELNEQWLEH